jgi:acetyl-CoA C-acetyltransferase
MTVGPSDWDDTDPSTPVIVGVSRVEQALDQPGAGLGPLELMIEAAHGAGNDSGAPGLLRDVGRVSVPEGTWTLINAPGSIAEAVGAPHARTVVLKAGIPQQTLLNETFRELLAGNIDAGLVVGGEASHRASVARRAGLELDDPDPSDTPADEVRGPEGEILSPPEIAARAIDAVVQYALMESALRFAESESLDENRDAIARLWSGLSDIASRNPHAAFREPMTADAIREPSDSNRLMAFPYNKWHCSQMYVDQASALLLTTLGNARRAGVPAEKVVFPLVSLESSFALSLARRAEPHTWPSMSVLRDAAEAHLGRNLADLDHFEVYSCFPAAVRIQQRALGLPIDGIPTITGGMAFAGGPWNNFVLQAISAMVERVREAPGSVGMVSVVSGLLTKPGLGVYSTVPGDSPPLIDDLAKRASEATAEVRLADGYAGPATVVACTVRADRSGAMRSFVVADTPEGERCVVVSDDPGVGGELMAREFVGDTITIDGGTFQLVGRR